LLDDPGLAGATRFDRTRFFATHYSWPVIEQKYLDMLEQLSHSSGRSIEPLPGWFARRTRNLSAGDARHDAFPRALSSDRSTGVPRVKFAFRHATIRRRKSRRAQSTPAAAGERMAERHDVDC